MNVKSLRTAGPLDRDHAHAGVADHDRHAARTSIIGMQRERGARSGSREPILGYSLLLLAPRSFDHNSAIHLLVGNFDPMAVQPDFGALVGRAVKAFGERAVHVGRDEPAILLGRRHRAVVGDLGQNSLHQLRRGGADFDHRVARIVAGLADRDLGDAKLAAAGRDRVQHLGQDEAVDDMAGDFDLFDTIGDIVAGSLANCIARGRRGLVGSRMHDGCIGTSQRYPRIAESLILWMVLAN